MKLKLLFASILTTFIISISAQCLEIESILVDACVPGTGCTSAASPNCSCEGKNEMVRFKVGSNNLIVSDLTVNWPNNSFLGWCQDASTAGIISTLNSTIGNSCGWLLEPTGGVLPSNATVLIISSTEMCTSANSFYGLNDTLYVIFQCAGNFQGHFANYNSTPATRDLTITNTGSNPCFDMVSYDRSLLININGSTGGSTSNLDGSSVAYDPAGNPTYYNNGCQAPITTYNVDWSFTDEICNTYGVVDLTALLSPNATVGGTWLGLNVTSSTYTPNALGIDSITYSVIGTGACGDTIDSTIVFQVVEIQQGTLNLQSCDSLSYGGTMYYSSTTLNNTIVNSNPYYCDSLLQVNIVINSAFIDSSYLSSCDSILYNSNYYYADTIIRDTVLGGNGSSGVDTVLHTSFEDSEGWTDHSTGNWTQVDSYGTWSAVGMYANQFNPNTGTRYIGMNDVGDYIELPPVDNPTTFEYYDRLSGPLSGTNVFAIEYFNGTSWVEIGRDTCTHEVYELVSIDVSALSGMTGVIFRIYRTNDSRSGYIDDLTIYGQTSTSSSCDSIYITNIEILLPIFSSNIDTIGCDSVNIASTWYTTSGLVNDTIISGGSNSCDSITVYNVVVNSSIITTSSTTSCNPTDVGTNMTGPFTVVNGCDSTHYDTVTLAPFSSASVNIPGCDSALANGTWYFASTSFNDTIIGGGSNGCDSVTTFNITISNSIVTTSSSTSCNPADVGTNMTGPFTMLNGCDSTHYDTVTLAPFSSASVNIPDCDSALANGTWYFASTSFNDTIIGGGSNGCDSITTFNVVVNNSIVTTSSSTSCNPADVGTNMTGPFTMLNGCDSIHFDTISLLLDTSTINSSFTDCDSVFYSGSWYFSSTTVLDTVFNVQGCDSVYYITDINIAPEPTSNYTFTCTIDPMLARNDTITLTNSLGCDSVYNITSTTFIDTLYNNNFLNDCDSLFYNGSWYTSSTTVLDTVFSTSGCDSIYNQTFITINFSTGSQQSLTICQGDSAFLSNEWQTVSDIYYDTIVVANNCDSIITTTLTVIPVQINTPIILNYCSNELPILIYGNNVNVAGTYFDTIQSGLGCDSIINATTLQINDTSSTYVSMSICEGDSTLINGVYQSTSGSYLNDTLSGTNGCDLYEYIDLTVNAYPSIILGNDTSILEGTTYYIDILNASSSIEYSWTNSLGETYIGESIFANSSQTAQYYVIATNSSNCSTNDSILITIIPNIKTIIAMPTAFSPNGDGKNDLFRVANFEDFESYKLSVYNRWGELIFIDEGYGVAWDGTYKNKEQNVDVYTYYVEAIVKDTKEEMITSGNVTLIK